MTRENKAHRATANRIAMRYGANYTPHQSQAHFDLQIHGLTIEVETTATIAAGVRRLKKLSGAAYVAVTNKEGLIEALRLVDGSTVGVMDPQGNIIKTASPIAIQPGSADKSLHESAE